MKFSAKKRGAGTVYGDMVVQIESCGDKFTAGVSPKVFRP
jgi:hypothetical protein